MQFLRNFSKIVCWRPPPSPGGLVPSSRGNPVSATAYYRTNHMRSPPRTTPPPPRDQMFAPPGRLVMVRESTYFYRPQRRLYFYGCLSAHGGGGLLPGEMPAPGGGGLLPGVGGVETPPESRRLLLRTVRILLECILVFDAIFPTTV